MNSKPSDKELLEEGLRAADRVITQLKLRSPDLKSKQGLAKGSELLEQALAATENVRSAIEGALGGTKDNPGTRKSS